MVIFLKTQTHAFLNLWSIEGLVHSPDVIFQYFSSPSSSQSCEQTALKRFLLLQCFIYQVISSCFLHLWQLAGVPRGVLPCSFYLLSDPLLRVVWPVSRNNGEAVWHFTGFSALSQQESFQCHSYSDSKSHQTAHMLKVRKRKPASNHFWDYRLTWGIISIIPTMVISNTRGGKLNPKRLADIARLNQLRHDIFLVLQEMNNSSLIVSVTIHTYRDEVI